MPQMDGPDVVRQPLEPLDPTGQHARRMHHDFAFGQAFYRGVAPDLGAAGKDEAGRMLLVGQRKLGMLQLVDITIDEFALAGSAVAGKTAVGEVHASAPGRIKNGFAVKGVERFAGIGKCEKRHDGVRQGWLDEACDASVAAEQAQGSTGGSQSGKLAAQ